MSRRYSWLLLMALLVAGIYAAGRVYLQSLGPTVREGASVTKPVPLGTTVVDRGEATDADAARALAAAVTAHPGTRRIAVSYLREGTRVHVMADFPGGSVERWAAGPGGTLVDTVWPTEVSARLRWAAEHGDFDAPGLPPPASRNLYH